VFCRSCGKGLPDGSIFCPSCGAEQGAAQPTTTKPTPVAVKRRNWFRRHPILTGLFGLVILLIVLGIATGGNSSKSTSSTSPHLTGRVNGQLTKDTITLGLNNADKQALKALTWSNVYCGWDGNHVTVHIDFKSTLAAHLSVEVQPRYSIQNGGLHGTSVDSRTSFGVPATGSYTWWGNAGSPAGEDKGRADRQVLPTTHQRRPRLGHHERAEHGADHRHGVPGDVRDLLVGLAGVLGDHDRVGERELRRRVGGARAEQLLALLVVNRPGLRANDFVTGFVTA
jgi:hypothetical protein